MDTTIATVANVINDTSSINNNGSINSSSADATNTDDSTAQVPTAQVSIETNQNTFNNSTTSSSSNLIDFLNTKQDSASKVRTDTVQYHVNKEEYQKNYNKK